MMEASVASSEWYRCRKKSALVRWVFEESVGLEAQVAMAIQGTRKMKCFEIEEWRLRCPLLALIYVASLMVPPVREEEVTP